MDRWSICQMEGSQLCMRGRGRKHLQFRFGLWYRQQPEGDLIILLCFGGMNIYEASLFPWKYQDYSCSLLSALLFPLLLQSIYRVDRFICRYRYVPFSVRAQAVSLYFFRLQLTVVSAIKVNCSRDKPTDSVSLIEKLTLGYE